MIIAFCDCTTPECQAEGHTGRPRCANSGEATVSGPPAGWRACAKDEKIVSVCPECNELLSERAL